MNKQAPPFGRIMVAVGFTLSCFGLLLFLWIAFGGPIPLKPEAYRVTVYFPEATQLAQESDVRIGGVSVGKVKTIDVAPADVRVGGVDVTEAVIEIQPEFAPISSDARAVLRAKTLLGETYVELTSGTEPGEEGAPVSLGAWSGVSDAEAERIEAIPEGGTLGLSRIHPQTQVDEIFNALDHETRTAFQRWMANAAIAVEGRGLDLNDSFGNLGPFLADASEILSVLRRQRPALRGLVRDTGTVFAALSERNEELAGAITGSRDTFTALASESEALAETFRILPTFERESRLTFERLDRFQQNTSPLVRELLPVANDISPTLRSVRELAPPLESFFRGLDPLISVSERGLPATDRFLEGLDPVLDALDPFLANLNPVIAYLGFYRGEVGHFISNPPAALSGTLPKIDNQPAPRHALRQLSYTSSESLSVYPQRLDTNRGNAYLPNDFLIPEVVRTGAFPAFECRNTDYGASTDPDEDEVTREENPPPDVNNGQPAGVGFAGCLIVGDFPARFGGQRGPQLYADP